ncbi:DUF1232 domain-containing protein [bacterium]|nr:DUF1232 domain-containing protein [bacterium]
MSQSRGKLNLDSITGLMKLNHTARLFMALYLDPRVSLWLKIAATSGVVYKFSPLDVEPDAITGIGLLDDIIVSLIIMQAFIEFAPERVILEKCEQYGIDRSKVYVDVARTVEEARELYHMLRRYGAGAQQVVQGFAQQAADVQKRMGEASNAPAPHTASGDTGEERVRRMQEEPEEPSEKPRYSQYSAFNPES